MIKNYLKIAYRNLLKRKLYSFINITGLAIGMASCILILMWVQDELSFDKFHSKADRIFKTVERWYTDTGTTHDQAYVPYALAPELRENYPEIEAATRVLKRDIQVSHDENVFLQKGCIVEPEFMDIFDFPLVQGEMKTGFKDLASAFITENLAQKLLGQADPIGKILKLKIGSRILGSFRISGVLRNIPSNSNIKFEILIPFDNKYLSYINASNMWRFNNLESYVLLRENAQLEKVNQKIKDILRKNGPSKNVDLYLHPLARLHLSSNISGAGGGDLQYIYMFSALAFLVLGIACLNFINLSTARGGERAREIGVLKVLGEKRSGIMGRFFGESFLLTFISMVLALFLVALLIPVLNTLSGKFLSFAPLRDLSQLLGFVAVGFATSVIAGIYPALYLSSFNPATVMKGSGDEVSKKSTLRKVLVVMQFSFSVFLVICTLAIYKQLHFISNKNLGFNKENIVALSMQEGIRTNYRAFRSDLLSRPDIKNMVFTSSLPGFIDNGTSEVYWERKAPDNKLVFSIMDVDYRFIETFGIPMSKGRFFSPDHQTDRKEALVINEAAARLIGQSSVGTLLKVDTDKKRKIIGVVKDFNFFSLHQGINPLILRMSPYYNYVCIKISSQNLSRTMSFLKTTFKKFAPGDLFQYTFVDEKLNELYHSEEKMGSIFRYFTALAIVISCLGLLGLASFNTQKRTREIGIRKVLGASTGKITGMFIKDFVKWILIANMISWPIAWYAMSHWLEDFTYKVNLGIVIFVISGILSVFVALLTVSFQCLKAASANPVHSMKQK